LKILLTGATGFIGANFLRQALARGHQVAALATPGKNTTLDLPNGENLIWLRGTLGETPWREIAAFSPEVCVHSAWITTPGVYLESPLNLQFLKDSLNFLKQAREAGASQIIALGTCIEYQIGREILSEDRTPIAPATLYARCKNDLRMALEAAAADKFALAWARVFYPYGPGEHPSRLCGSIIQKLSRDEKIVLKAPDSTKDYIYIDDLGAALLAVAEKKYSGAINLGTGVGITVREIARTLARLMGKPDLVSEMNPPETDPLGYVVADASRLLGLGWRPKFSLERGLEMLVRKHF
jgi:nucleoside-diphosphate-sugar epimerase